MMHLILVIAVVIILAASYLLTFALCRAATRRELTAQALGERRPPVGHCHFRPGVERHLQPAAEGLYQRDHRVRRGKMRAGPHREIHLF